MEVFEPALLAVSAFWLGACPFSLWVGRLFLRKDIRDYGDGNPGAANVFRAGGRISGCIAAILDVAKGVPFVFLAHSRFAFPEYTVMAVAFSAILGHAFSPLLGFKGGKAIAVTIGTMIALPQHELLVAFLALTFLGFLFIENDGWTVIFGAGSSLIYLVVTNRDSSQSVFALCLLVLLAVKHFSQLRALPGWKIRPLGWIQSRRRVV